MLQQSVKNNQNTETYTYFVLLFYTGIFDVWKDVDSR